MTFKLDPFPPFTNADGVCDSLGRLLLAVLASAVMGIIIGTLLVLEGVV